MANLANSMRSADETEVSLSDGELEQIERANLDGRRPVVFVHGLWLLPNSWDRWATLFEHQGFVSLTPNWPGEPDDVRDARANPELMARKRIVRTTDHHQAIIRRLSRAPAIVGHSFGGAIAQILAARGLSTATVAIDPAALRGALPLPFSALKSAWPALRNPFNRGHAVPLSLEQFTYSFANAVDEIEARELYEAYAVPGAGMPLFQAAVENLNPWTDLQVDWHSPIRGPLLMIAGAEDHTVPPNVVEAGFELQRANPGITELVTLEGRGHSLTIDHGWREVAEEAISFLRRFPGQTTSAK